MPRKRAKRKVQQVEAEDKEGDGEDGEEEDKEEDADKMGAEHRVDDIIMSDHPLTVPPVAGTTAPTSTPEEAKSNFTTTQVYPLGSFGSGGYEINLVDYDKGRQTGRPDMDQNWSSSGYYGYFGNDSATRASDRGGASISPNEEPQHSHQPHQQHQLQQQQQHRRPSQQYLPPPPHSTSPHNMNLPPFQQTFYQSAYHSPSGQHPSMGGQMHHMPQQGPMGYGNQSQHMMPPPGGPGGNPYPYPVVSPAMSAPPLPGGRQPPPHSYSESPRTAGAGGYSSSPNFHQLSPASPTTHLIPPGIQASSASASSSSYQSARAGMQGLMRDNGSIASNKRRDSEGGASGDGDSWDEGDSGKHDGDQPWGMPQDEYKKLNPRDKKQVRNRIGARRFRAKRKDYVSNLENTLKQRDDECSSLRTQVESHRSEINDLRHRLGMPMLPLNPAQPQSQSSGDSSALGLVVPGGAEWNKHEV